MPATCGKTQASGKSRALGRVDRIRTNKVMTTPPKAWIVGGGIGSLPAAAFMIRDGKLSGGNISILEAAPVTGGSLDGAGDPAHAYSLRRERMLTSDNYECT